MIDRKKIILFFVAIVVSLTLAEFILRLVPGFTPQPRFYPGEMVNRGSKNFVADNFTGWRMRPNNEFAWRISGKKDRYVSNQEGFRINPNDQSSPSEVKIVLVGDSFTFGTGVSYKQTFGAKLEKVLPGVSIYNLAMPGFGIDQIWMSIRHQALELEPSLIVVGFIDNDFHRSLTAYRYVEGFNKPMYMLANDILQRRTVEHNPNIVVREIERYSAIWSVLQGVGRRIARRYPFGEWWQLNKSMFLAMIKEAREASVPILFVRIPDGRWRRFDTLSKFMRAVTANYLDLSNPQVRPPYEIHFKYDGHINERGHEFVTQALIRWIQDQKIERLQIK